MYAPLGQAESPASANGFSSSFLKSGFFFGFCCRFGGLFVLADQAADAVHGFGHQVEQAVHGLALVGKLQQLHAALLQHQKGDGGDGDTAARAAADAIRDAVSALSTGSADTVDDIGDLLLDLVETLKQIQPQNGNRTP